TVGVRSHRRDDQQRGWGDQLQTLHRVHRRGHPRRDHPIPAHHPLLLPRRTTHHGRTRPRRHRQRLLGRHPRHPPHPLLRRQRRRQRPDRLPGHGIRRRRHPRRGHRPRRHRSPTPAHLPRHPPTPQRHR